MALLSYLYSIVDTENNNNGAVVSPIESSSELVLHEKNISQDDVNFVIGQLTSDELETAARTSYHYQKTPSPDDTMRLKYASMMAQRYVTSKSDPCSALEKMKATLEFRNQYNLNDLDKMTELYNKQLCQFMNDKKSYVQGYDNDGRATYLFIPRRVTDHDNPERTLRGHIWSIEKAIACTKSIDQTINVVVDFTDFSLYMHSPPFKVGKDLMTTLRNHYVGHVYRIFLVNVPTTFSILWSIFKSFAGSKTRDKIVFVDSSTSNGVGTCIDNSVHGEKNNANNVLCQYYSTEQTTSWMIHGGEKNRELDCEEYVNQIPFDQSFDE